jgi:hypothetical protein
MIISVKFKDKNKIFKGRSYDYKLNSDERIPKVGSIIRMMNNDYSFRCNGTRVRVENVRKESIEDSGLEEIRYLESSLEEPSFTL